MESQLGMKGGGGLARVDTCWSFQVGHAQVKRSSDCGSAFPSFSLYPAFPSAPLFHHVG